MRTFTEWSDALEASVTDVMGVGGTLGADGRPVYFLHPLGAENDEIELLAFEARHGRPMSDGEQRLLGLARSERPGFLDADADTLVVE